MIKSQITDEETRELQFLYSEIRNLATQAGIALEKYGAQSPEFLKADIELGKAIIRTREIRGISGHWMT